MLPAPNAALPRFLGGTPKPQYRLLQHSARPPAIPQVPAPQPPNLRPVLNGDGQVVAYVVAPTSQPAPAPKPQGKSAQIGNAVLGVATTGLGVAGMAFPPALPIAGITGVVQAIDSQIGSPIATVVGATVQGVGEVGGLVVKGVEGAITGIGDGIDAVGKFFGGLFD